MLRVKVFEKMKCRVCGSTHLSKWVHLPLMPLTDDLKQGDNRDAFLHDINVYICESCHISQTISEIDLSDYYVDYSYTVAGSNFATNFMRKLARSIFERFNVSKNGIVIEVGSGDGKQLSFFKELGAKVFGFEPSAELCRRSEEMGVPVYQGLFTDDSIINVPTEYMNANVLLLTYTFDHIPAPVSFLETVKKIIDPINGLLVIEVHDLDKIAERREYCLFEHEHFIYLNAETMKSLLERLGFELITTDLLSENERRGNSLLIVAAMNGSIYSSHKQDSPPKKVINYDSFNREMLDGIKRLDDFIELNIANGKKVAGYGAGGRGVMTLAAMKSANKLLYLCDNNLNSHGKYTPKSNIVIRSPEHLQEEPVDVLLVFSFGYMNEIREQVSKLSNAPMQVISMLEVL